VMAGCLSQVRLLVDLGVSPRSSLITVWFCNSGDFK
jgi:hypothetical protein